MPFLKSFYFIIMIAALMGISALGIDAVLPAFPEIRTAFNLQNEHTNDVQLIVFVFMLGFASMQLAFGILADIFGRKKMLILGLIIYAIASISVVFINEFSYLLIARFLQGAGLSAPRVIVQAIVRDVVSGRQMAKIMSFAMMVFLLVPTLAPFIGQFALTLGDWHSIFYLFFMIGIFLIAWVGIKLPETLPKEKREVPNFNNITRAMLISFSHRPTFIYMLMIGLMFSMLMTYISQSEQIFGSVIYGLGDKFPIAFAVSSLGMIVASFLNSRIVIAVGMHKIVKRALGIMMLGDILMIIAAYAYSGIPPLWIFMPLLMLHLFCFSLSMPNLNSILLEPHGNISGTVAAVVGTMTTIIGVAVGHTIADLFTNNIYPLALGWGLLALLNNILNTYVNHITGYGTNK